LSTHVCRLPGSISGSCSASLEPNPDSKIYRTLSSARLRWDRRGNLATTSASLRYWNSARQRYCRQSVRYRKTLASLPTRLPSQQPRPARKAGFSTFENDCGRETDCLLEQDGFEPSVPLAKVSAPAAEGEMPKRSKVRPREGLPGTIPWLRGNISYHAADHAVLLSTTTLKVEIGAQPTASISPATEGG